MGIESQADPSPAEVEIGVPAESPAANQDVTPSEAPADPFAAFEAALAKTQAKPTEGEEKSSDSPEPEPEPSAPEASDTAPEDKPPPFHAHPRWKEVNRELRAAKEQLEATRDKAERFERIEGWMTRQGVSPDELEQAVSFAAALRNADAGDAAKTLEAILPVVQRLQERAGKVLSPDLAEMVEQGYITPELAAEQAKLAAQAAQAKAQLERYEAAQAEQRSQAILGAIAAEEQRLRSDPDYESKAELVEAQLQAMVARQGLPETPEQAARMVREAAETVNKSLGRMMPAPRPVKPAIGPAARNATPTPRNAWEAFEQGLGG